jgi:hypothetical protein
MCTYLLGEAVAGHGNRFVIRSLSFLYQDFGMVRIGHSLRGDCFMLCVFLAKNAFYAARLKKLLHDH